MASESIELQEQFARFQFHSMSTAKTFYVKQSEDETAKEMHNIMTTLGDTTQKDIHEMTLNFKRLLIASNGDNRMKEKMKTQLDSWWEEVEEKEKSLREQKKKETKEGQSSFVAYKCCDIWLETPRQAYDHERNNHQKKRCKKCRKTYRKGTPGVCKKCKKQIKEEKKEESRKRKRN